MQAKNQSPKWPESGLKQGVGERRKEGWKEEEEL